MSAARQPDDTNTVKDADNWVSGDDPMTGAQASYLRTLSDEAHQDLPEEPISKAEASKRIDELKGDLHLQTRAKPSRD